MRNDDVEASAIDDAVYSATAAKCAGIKCVLSIQDTTSTAVKSRKVAQLEDIGSSNGFQAHTALAVDASTGVPLGLLDQQRWMRDPARQKKSKGVKKARTRADYKKKESYRWEQCQRNVMSRLPDMSKVITVCDREAADIFDFLSFMSSNEQRFVQRASSNRRVQGGTTIRGALKSAKLVDDKDVVIEQRGPVLKGKIRSRRAGRKTRVATVEIRAATVKMRRPDVRRDLPQWLDVNVVLVHEPRPPRGTRALDWLLLTSEPVGDAQSVQTVVGYYEKRWLIEEFHKSWKTGCRIEQRPFGTPKNLDRLYAMTAPIAVRVLQLHALQGDKDTPVDCILDPLEWKCLHLCVAPGKPLPKKTPSIDWVAKSLAGLAGWRNTKGTGRIGWDTLWCGWSRFQERLAGFKMAATVGGNL